MKRARIVLGVALVGVLGLAAPRASLAQDAGPPRYSERIDSREFEPAPEGQEQVSAPLMVTLAYAFIWLLAMGFVASTWRRSRGLAAELDSARRRLDALDERLAGQLGTGEEAEG